MHRYSVHPLVWRGNEEGFGANFKKTLYRGDSREAADRVGNAKQRHYSHGVVRIDWETADAWHWGPGHPVAGHEVIFEVNKADWDAWVKTMEQKYGV